MTKDTRRNYSKEFKIEAVNLIESEGYSLGNGSIRLGISKSTLASGKPYMAIEGAQILLLIKRVV